MTAYDQNNMLPLTYPWIIKHHFQNYKTILDVGSGNGAFMAIVNQNHQYVVTGVELFDPYIELSKSTKVYKDIVKADVRDLDFPPDSFDVVHCSQVVEHLKPEETRAMLKHLESVASKKIIIGTPNGHYDQDEYDGNELQRHQSFWTVQDFEQMGYRVYGQGLKAIYGEKGLLFTSLGKDAVIRAALMMLSYLTAPLVYFIPTLGAHLIAVKEK